MPGGRPPKPTALKLLLGNAGKRKIRADEPQPAAAPTDAPAFLKGLALEEWNLRAPECLRLGLLTVLDVSKLAAYCVAYGRWRRFEALCDETDAELAIAKGYVNAANKTLQVMRQLATQFGFDPSSRSKVHAKPREPESKLTRFLGGHKKA